MKWSIAGLLTQTGFGREYLVAIRYIIGLNGNHVRLDVTPLGFNHRKDLRVPQGGGGAGRAKGYAATTGSKRLSP